jgi:hypothetical protein
VNLLRNNDRQRGILQRVALEDIRERRADYSAEAEFSQCPRRVLARTAAAEVIAGQQKLRVLSAGIEEEEILS